jgi:hypothetical protein
MIKTAGRSLQLSSYNFRILWIHPKLNLLELCLHKRNVKPDYEFHTSQIQSLYSKSENDKFIQVEICLIGLRPFNKFCLLYLF